MYGFSAKSSIPTLNILRLLIRLFLQKLNIYNHIPNIYLGFEFEFEFGPQRIRNVAFRVSVVRAPVDSTSQPSCQGQP